MVRWMFTHSPGLLASGIVSSVLIFGLLISSDGPGGTRVWAWMLTAMQVTAMWVAGSGRRSGWLVGASVQPAWIAYALLTRQEGFILGCVVSAVVQTSNYVRTPRPMAKNASNDDGSDGVSEQIVVAFDGGPQR